MLREADIADAAEVLLASYGRSAHAEARARSQACAADGDAVSGENWLRVAALIFRLLECGEDHGRPPH